MKRTLLILIVLSLIILAGCSLKPAPDPTEAKPAETTAPTQEATEPQPTVPENLVEDAFVHSLKYTYQDYVSAPENVQDVEMTVHYYIPKINLPGKTIQQINEEIYGDFKQFVDYSQENIDLNDYPVSYGISYEWAVHGDTLSLIIHNRLGSEYGGTQHSAYNISLSSATIAERNAVLAIAGFSEEDFLKTAKEAMLQHFQDAYPPQITQDASMHDFAEQQLANTLSDENINEIKLYLDENKHLWIIWREYSLAGADYYWYSMDLTEFFTSAPDDRARAFAQYKQILSTYPGKVLLFTYGSPATDVYADTLYTLYDIDQDGIEELIIQKESTEYHIFSYIDGSAILCGTEIWSYYDCLYEYDGNGIAVHDGDTGSMHFEYIELYTLAEGKLTYSTTLKSSEECDVGEAIKSYTNIPAFRSITDLSALEP